LQGEIMVATNLFGAHGGAGTLSRVTLALMQDSGWYDVNWGEAGEIGGLRQVLLPFEHCDSHHVPALLVSWYAVLGVARPIQKIAGLTIQ
jgi:hypothetical protein